MYLETSLKTSGGTSGQSQSRVCTSKRPRIAAGGQNTTAADSAWAVDLRFCRDGSSPVQTRVTDPYVLAEMYARSNSTYEISEIKIGAISATILAFFAN